MTWDPPALGFSSPQPPPVASPQKRKSLRQQRRKSSGNPREEASLTPGAPSPDDTFPLTETTRKRCSSPTARPRAGVILDCRKGETGFYTFPAWLPARPTGSRGLFASGRAARPPGVPGGGEPARPTSRITQGLGRVTRALDSVLRAVKGRPGLQGSSKGRSSGWTDRAGRGEGLRNPGCALHWQALGNGSHPGPGVGSAGWAHLSAGRPGLHMPKLGHLEAVHGSWD